jgi:peptidoglycan/xylan/chitin deacetylase (PgdA/CDA1 family)
VAGTFFAMGAHLEEYPDAILTLLAQGHTVGNHTYSHSGLVDLVTRGGDACNELLRADRILEAAGHQRLKAFRPPYGSWPEGASARRLVNRLNADERLREYVGPVLWDVSAEDYSFWERGRTAAECCDAYLDAIGHADHGIVLLHDSSEKDPVRRNNRTLEAVTRLLPRLRRRGYGFVPLQFVPQIRGAISRRS